MASEVEKAEIQTTEDSKLENVPQVEVITTTTTPDDPENPDENPEALKPPENTSDVVEEPPKIGPRNSIGSCSLAYKQRIGTSLATGGTKNQHLGKNESTMAKSQSEIQVCATNSLSISQTSRNSLMTFSSSGTFYDHSKRKVDLRMPPKPVQSSTTKDAADFRQMEQGLLQLLEDFHSGKLEAFGQSGTFEKMENVREQQEKLARLHFDLNAKQELCGQHTNEGIRIAKENLSKLMENLRELSHSIEQLQPGNQTEEGTTGESQSGPPLG